MSLCILIPDAADITRYDDPTEQAAQIEALTPGLSITYLPWTTMEALDRFALVLPLMAWGYHRDVARWYAQLDRWEAEGARFVNPLQVLRWNTDKRYLRDLAERGVAVVPTRFHDALTVCDIDAARGAFGAAIVIKPPVSAGSDDTWLLGEGDPVPAQALDRAMLIQPMMPAIADSGELSLFYMGGVLAHAVVKRPAAGDFRVQPQFGGKSMPATPDAAALALAEATLAAVAPDLLYARVDMIADGRVGYALMEVELIEPWLYLHRAADKGAAFAEALKGRIAA